MIKTIHIPAAFNKCYKEDRNIDFYKPTGQTAQAVVTLKKKFDLWQGWLVQECQKDMKQELLLPPSFRIHIVSRIWNAYQLYAKEDNREPPYLIWYSDSPEQFKCLRQFAYPVPIQQK